MIKIQPCPYCGARPQTEIFGQYKAVSIICHSCGLVAFDPDTGQDTFSDFKTALLSWNAFHDKIAADTENYSGKINLPGLLDTLKKYEINIWFDLRLQTFLFSSHNKDAAAHMFSFFALHPEYERALCRKRNLAGPYLDERFMNLRDLCYNNIAPAFAIPKENRTENDNICVNYWDSVINHMKEFSIMPANLQNAILFAFNS